MGFVSLMVLNSLYKNQHIHLGLKEVLLKIKQKRHKTNTICTVL